jgi:hypothetical protein
MHALAVGIGTHSGSGGPPHPPFTWPHSTRAVPSAFFSDKLSPDFYFF